MRGNIRLLNARCTGAYAHSAALPRRFRSDTVMAVAELALALDDFWERRIAAGDTDFVVTIGQVSTDPAAHAMTKVPGRVDFSVNVGSAQPAILEEARAFLDETVARIACERRAAFDLVEEIGTQPTPIPPWLREALANGAADAGIDTIEIPTVGHDAAMFAKAGVPEAVVLVRNEGGSHNPNERLEKADFAAGTRAAANAMLRIARSAAPG